MVKSNANIFERKRYFVPVGLLLFILLLGCGYFFLRVFFSTVSDAERMRLEMYKATLYSTIEQYNYLPFLLSQDRLIHTHVISPNPASRETVNVRLASFNKALRTTALFIVDAKGQAIASSNWQEPGSYVGQDYSFRPYYTQAMEGRLGKFYGIGSTTLRPGFFLSFRIEHEGHIAGVMVVKISLNDIERAWSEGPDNIYVSDEHSVIFLSVNPHWRIKSLHALPPQVLEKFEETKQYNISAVEVVENYSCFDFHGIKLFNLNKSQSCLFPRYYRQTVAIPEFHWEMASVSSMKNVYLVTAIAATVILIAYLFLLMLFKYLRMRIRAQNILEKNNEYLEREVSARTRALKGINQRLLQAMKERIEAERTLQHTRSELAESSKLAALGQMATELAHEQNQPLAALHALTDNARKMLGRHMYAEADQNLRYIITVIERMTQNISEMKSFASRHRVPKGNANVIKALYNAVALLSHNLKKNRVERRINISSSSLMVGCDGHGLEQIFSNLIINAIDAMENQPVKRLDITIREHDAQVIVAIKDTGPGVPPEVQSRIFEPFFTTKRRGMGLGLAIVSEIVTSSHGTISANNHPDGGTVFTLVWAEWREQNETASS